MAYAGPRAETPRLQNPFTSWLPRVAPGSFAAASPAPETSTDDLGATGALGDRGIASEYRPHARRVPNDLAALIAAKAHKHHVPVALAHAVVTVESNYNPHVTGRGATIGLMQIKHPTARSMGFGGTVKELYEPGNNLEYGMRYLSAAHRLAKGDVCGTIMRYQGGLRALRMSPEASVYCTRVRKLLAATPEGKQLLAGRTHAKQRTAEAR